MQGQASESRDLVKTTAQLREPLELCYHSLHACGMGNIADGMLLDVLRKLACFGIHLVKLDIRQDGERHGQVFSELTRYLGMGDYAEWSEDDKQAFLLNELNSRRPLIPTDWEPSDETRETLDTCKVIAQHDPDAFGIYIISMAGAPSDVLAVQLLLKEAGCKFRMPVAPLFETQEDLMAGTAVMERLLSVDWYRGYIQGRQYVMIGYSDSAKDAGMMAAGWAQYAAMESLVALAEANNLRLTLFHGRGGTVGRGGAPPSGDPVATAGIPARWPAGNRTGRDDPLQVRPAQGGHPEPQPLHQRRAGGEPAAAAQAQGVLARRDGAASVCLLRSLPQYRARSSGLRPLLPRRHPGDGARQAAARLAPLQAQAQRRGREPARHPLDLRLDPEPADAAGLARCHKGLQQAIADGQKGVLEEMSRQWPFFRTRLEMLEMVFLKADVWLAEYYDTRLVPKELWGLGKQLRQELADSIQVVLELRPQGDLLDDQPWIKESIKLRNPYTDPLNVLQVELLGRSRNHAETLHPELDQALMVTIAGIAAGMRNTG